jgi:GNAT superfamily N-acetyltransferase
MQVRRVRRGEGAELRALRLRALQDAPFAFSSSFDEEVGEPDAAWADLAAQSESAETAVVMVAVDDQRWLGMAGGFVEGSAAGVWGMWVAPDARGEGLGEQLVESVVDWARERGASRVELSVTERARDAAALYERLGFKPTGERRQLASDPSVVEILLTRRS